MHSNLSDHNYWSKSLDAEHSSALEILGSKVGSSSDSSYVLDYQEKTGNQLGSKVGSSSDSSYVLDYQEKTGKQQPKVANIRLKGNNNKCQGNKKPRKKNARIGECGGEDEHRQSKICSFMLGTLCLSCSCKFHSIFTAEDFDCCPSWTDVVKEKESDINLFKY